MLSHLQEAMPLPERNHAPCKTALLCKCTYIKNPERNLCFFFLAILRATGLASLVTPPLPMKEVKTRPRCHHHHDHHHPPQLQAKAVAGAFLTGFMDHHHSTRHHQPVPSQLTKSLLHHHQWTRGAIYRGHTAICHGLPLLLKLPRKMLSRLVSVVTARVGVVFRRIVR